MQSLIYLAAGITTGWQLYRLMMWAIWGRPTSASEYVALLGALILVVAAFSGLFSRSACTIIAAAACTLLWIFYLPALVVTLFYSSPAAAWDWVVLIPPLLLTAATTRAIAELVALVKTERSLP
jgi:membrane-associated HD superfamily phosphohydrolase